MELHMAAQFGSGCNYGRIGNGMCSRVFRSGFDEKELVACMVNGESSASRGMAGAYQKIEPTKVVSSPSLNLLANNLNQ